MSKRIQLWEEHLWILACEIIKTHGHRLTGAKVRTVPSQENWAPKAWDPGRHDSSNEEDIIKEEENYLQACPLIQTKTQATQEPGDDQEEIPTGPKMTAREYYTT